jgi:DNA-binding response OmpR family regulator
MLRNARILIVENEPLLALELTQTIIEAKGTIAATARSREEAARLAITSEVNVAVLDVKLPDGKSFSVAKILAERGIPFLFCTGDVADQQQFKDWPGVPVIGKPYKTEAMIQEISSLLSRHSPSSRLNSG